MPGFLYGRKIAPVEGSLFVLCPVFVSGRKSDSLVSIISGSCMSMLNYLCQKIQRMLFLSFHTVGTAKICVEKTHLKTVSLIFASITGHKILSGETHGLARGRNRL